MTNIRPAEIDDALNISEIWNYYISETAINFNATKKTITEVETVIDRCKQKDWAFLVAHDNLGVLGFST